MIRRRAILLFTVFLASFTSFAAYEYGSRVAWLLLVAYFLIGVFLAGYALGPRLRSTAESAAQVTASIVSDRFL